MSERYGTVFSMFAFIIPIFLFAGTADAKKPSAPLRISIAPSQEHIAPSDIKPGDLVEMAVTVRSFIDSPEMSITIRLKGGAQLVSGDTEWTGPVHKGEIKSVLFSVRAPVKGKGEITARASLSTVKGAAYASEDRYILGKEEKKKYSPLPPLKKDSRGRSIREFR